jgi:hypothetical protein
MVFLHAKFSGVAVNGAAVSRDAISREALGGAASGAADGDRSERLKGAAVRKVTSKRWGN